jgi:hypothetical protein
VISEASKIVLIKDRVPPSAAIPALAIENLLYGITVAAMMAAGAAALLSIFAVPPPVRSAALLSLVITVSVASAIAASVAARKRIISAPLGRLARRHGWRRIERSIEAVESMEDRVFGFASRDPRRTLKVLALQTSYHVSGVAEIWFVLKVVTGAPPSLVLAFVLESVNRMVMIAFQFVPMWIGVDEAATGLMAGALLLGPAAGVSLAIIRKTRIVLWTLMGFAIMAARGFPLRRPFRETDALVDPS